MSIPFTTEQFFDVFRQYNEAIWPLQIGLNLLALFAIALLIFHRPFSDRLISAILVLLWSWTGIVYHLVFFTSINEAALIFGVIYLLGAAAFLWAGVIKGRMNFISSDVKFRIVGAVLLAYSLVIYPLLSEYLGNGYPFTPTFGLPCPTTIFTIGMLSFLNTRFPRYILIAPILWSFIGLQAAFVFDLYQDMGLLISGLVALMLIFRRKQDFKLFRN